MRNWNRANGLNYVENHFGREEFQPGESGATEFKRCERSQICFGSILCAAAGLCGGGSVGGGEAAEHKLDCAVACFGSI